MRSPLAPSVRARSLNPANSNTLCSLVCFVWASMSAPRSDRLLRNIIGASRVVFSAYLVARLVAAFTRVSLPLSPKSCLR